MTLSVAVICLHRFKQKKICIAWFLNGYLVKFDQKTSFYGYICYELVQWFSWCSSPFFDLFFDISNKKYAPMEVHTTFMYYISKNF